MEKKYEIRRKAIHILVVIIPMLYYLVSRKYMLGLSGFLLIIAFSIEGFRVLNPKFNTFFSQRFDNLLRSHERKGLTGATYLFLSMFLTIFLFQKTIAICVLLILVISDGLGALVGKLWGHHRLYGFKTIEGSIVFILSAVIIILLVFQGPLWIGWIGLITAFGVEVLIQKIDDNLTIPIFSGGVMQALVLITQS